MDDRVLAMRELILTAGHADSGLPTLLQPGMDDSALRYGQSRVGTQSLTGGGFDQLSLFSNGPLSFEENIDLAMGRSLNLYAGTIAATGGGPSEVKLQAPYVRLSGIGMYGQQASGEFRPRLTYGPTATAEQVRLQVSAGRLLDIAGRLSFGSDGVINGVNAEAVRYQRPGFEKVTLRSEGDLRFAGDYPENGDPSGRLITHGDLQLTAAQLYPVTGASSTLYAGYGLDERGQAVFDAERHLAIERSGESLPDTPLSVFGSLAFMASNIEQGGVVRAPLGLIQFGSNLDRAPGTVRLLPGSLTSVSGAELVMPPWRHDRWDQLSGQPGPHSTDRCRGRPRCWDTGCGSRPLCQRGRCATGGAAGPVRRRRTRGGWIHLRQRGSTDARFHPLVQQDNDGFRLPELSSNPVYAIVPGHQAVSAPLGGEAGAIQPLVGQQVTIGDGVPGLAAGTYTLLPSTYALLPGAFRVEINGLAGQGAHGDAGVAQWLLGDVRAVVDCRHVHPRQSEPSGHPVFRRYAAPLLAVQRNELCGFHSRRCRAQEHPQSDVASGCQIPLPGIARG